MNLKVDIHDVKFAIKSLKDKAPGPSKLRKTLYILIRQNDS